MTPVVGDRWQFVENIEHIAQYILPCERVAFLISRNSTDVTLTRRRGSPPIASDSPCRLHPQSPRIAVIITRLTRAFVTSGPPSVEEQGGSQVLQQSSAPQ